MGETAIVEGISRGRAAVGTLFFVLEEIPTDTLDPRGRIEGYVGLERTKTSKVIFLVRGACASEGRDLRGSKLAIRLLALPSLRTSRETAPHTGSSLGECILPQHCPNSGDARGNHASVSPLLGSLLLLGRVVMASELLPGLDKN